MAAREADGRVFWSENLDHVPAPPAVAQMTPPQENATPGKAHAEIRTEPSEDRSVAIVGMAGFFPGSTGLQDFRDRLCRQEPLFQRIPADHRPEDEARNRSGSFIDNVDRFDAELFRVSALEARYMDPRLRLLLMATWHALEDACYTPEELRDSRVDVYVAAETTSYAEFLAQAETTAYSPLGMTGWALANRLSHAFRFRGKSLHLDTACSGSSVALHEAIGALRRRECQYALVATANLLLGRSATGAFITQETLGMQSRDDLCHPFQDKAMGFLPGEGVVAILLKRRADAIGDRDNIHGIVRGSAVNHAGGYGSFFMPSASAQAEVIARAHEDARIDPGTVGYVEAHGGSTLLADAEELKALKSIEHAIPKLAHVAEPRCKVSTIKANVGHANAASGMLSLIRALECVNRGIRLGIRGFDRLTDKVSIEGSRLYLNADSDVWERPRDVNGLELPRRAVVNNFGAGGVNAHLVVEEHLPSPNTKPPLVASDDDVWFLPLSAQTEEQLVRYADSVARVLQEPGPPSAADLEYLYATGRSALPLRVVFRFRELSELADKLQRFVSSAGARGFHQKSTAAPAHDGVDLFARHGQLKAYISGLREAKDKSLLFDLWVRGMEDPLAHYMRGHPRGKRSLPAYPFRLDAFWVSSEVVQQAAPELTPAEVTELHPAPRPDPLLTHIADILGRSNTELGSDRSMAQLGMSSMDVIALKVRLEKSLRVEIPAALLDLHTSIGELGPTIAHLAREARTAPAAEDLHPSFVPDPAGAFDPFPLTDIQSAIYSGRRMQVGGDWAGCHVYLEFEAADLDVERLNCAWLRLVDHHPTLRTVVLSSGTQQVRREVPRYRFNRFDMSRDPENLANDKLARLRTRLSHKVYGPDQWPLFDICVARVAGGRSRVLFSIDSWLIDAFALNLLLEQWVALYFEPDRPLRAAEITFRDYVVAMVRFEQTDSFKRILKRAIGKFSALPPGPLIPARSSQAAVNESFQRRALTAIVEAEPWAALKTTAAGHGVSPTAVVLALFATVLRNRNDGRPCTLNLTMRNRPPTHDDLQHMVGTLGSTHPYVAASNVSAAFVELARDADRGLKEAVDLSYVSATRVVRELRCGIVESKYLMPVVFTSLLNMPGGDASGTLRKLLSPVFSISQTPQVSLDHQIVERDNRLECTWIVTDGAYSEQDLDALFAEFSGQLDALCKDPGKWLEPLPATELSREVEAPRVALVTDPQARFEPFPLTTAQQALGFARSRFQSGERSACQLYCEITLPDCDIDRLRAAWRRCLQQHPALVTRIGGDGKQQVLAEIPDFEIEQWDLAGLPEERRKASLAATKDRMMAVNTPLGSWPYFAIAVSKLGDGDARVHFTIDMLVADGPSIQRVIKDWLRMYHDPGLELDRVTPTFRDYVMSLEAYRNTPAYQRDLAHWDRKIARFAGGPQLPHVAAAPGKIVRERFNVVFDRWAQLTAAAARRALKAEDVLLGAYMDVLARHARPGPFEIVVPYWDRIPVHPDIDRVVGDFSVMSWIPVCTEPLSFSDRCRAYARERAADARHRAVNGISRLRRGNQQGQALKYPIVFSLPLNEDDEAKDLFTRFEIGAVESKTGGVEIDNITDIHGDRAGLHWDVAVNVYPAQFARRMFDEYVSLLTSLARGEAGLWDEVDAREQES